MASKKQPDKPKRDKIKPADPRQLALFDFYLDPDSLCYGNAYQSAIRAGYSESYAKVFMARSNSWFVRTMSENVRKGPDSDDIVDRLFTEAKDARASKDRIRALEILAKIQKLFSDGTNVQINNSFGVSVPVGEMDDKQLDRIIAYGYGIGDPLPRVRGTPPLFLCFCQENYLTGVADHSPTEGR